MHKSLQFIYISCVQTHHAFLACSNDPCYYAMLLWWCCVGWEAAGSWKGLLWLVLTADQRQRTHHHNYWWAACSECEHMYSCTGASCDCTFCWFVFVLVQPLPSWSRCVRTFPPQSMMCKWTWFCTLIPEAAHTYVCRHTCTHVHQFNDVTGWVPGPAVPPTEVTEQSFQLLLHSLSWLGQTHAQRYANWSCLQAHLNICLCSW